MKNNEIDFRDISALVPHYDDMGGNYTNLVYKDGHQQIDKRRIKTVLTLLVQFFAMDLRIIRKKYGSYICQRNIVPLPLGSDITIIPFKLRKPMFVKDGSLGYIRLEDIREVKEDREGKGGIVLTNNYMIKSEHSVKICHKHINNGRLVKKLRDREFGKEEEQNYYTLLKDISARPATKEDIALLVKELIMIREKIDKKYNL